VDKISESGELIPGEKETIPVVSIAATENDKSEDYLS
jgi:hypothetical protein